MNNNNDSQIVKRIQAGDEAAFAELVAKYQRAIHGFAYHKTQDVLAAEDITQEVFLAAYLNLHTLHNPEGLGAWLRSIAHHKSVDWIRRHREVSPLMDDLPANGTSISETLESEEAYKQLSSIIQTLSEPNRIVVTLRYMEGLNNSQIADFLELSPSIVSTRLERARKQLQERMLTALETGFPKPDFVEVVCRQIQACKPVIGVGLQFSSDHKPMRLCTCASRVQSLAKRTESVCQEYPGEGLVIWYGINRIREDDAKKAVETALELQKQSCPAGSFFLCIRQILDRGSGSCPRFPCLIETDADNSASNDILVDSSIAWLLRSEFHFEEQHGNQVFSKKLGFLPDSVERYSVYKLTRNPSVDTPKTDILVGRVAEMEQLENAILRLLVGGSGIIRLTGEAGIGKTYLLRFLRKRCNLFLPLNRNCGENDCGQNAEAKSLIWLQGKANPGESYQPIREAIQSHFDFESADELKEHLASLGLENALPYFAELLHLPFESSNKKFNALTVEQIHHNAFQYLRDWLIKLAEDAPVVWVVDDTHWLSPESSRMLQYLCRTTKDSPVLFLFSRRSGYEQVPEAEYGIELEKQVAQRYPEVYQQIDLEPLREWAGLSLLSHFLGEQQLLPSKSDRILELAGGNPFYLREVAQLLIDAPDSLNVPLGIERLILAHLDLLPSVHQNLLRYASVLGSHVDMALLQAEFPEIELSKMFEQLQGIGWLQPAKEKRKPISLVWRHDLYRESIYNSVEPNARRQLHEEIAQQLEGNPETSPNLLTDHYEAAGKLEKAAHYASLAVAMHHEQQRHLRVQRYAEMALSHPETLSQEQHVEIHYQYARALGATGHSSEAVLHLEQALNLANTNSQRILINIQLAEYHHNQHGVALREKALSLIDESTETSVIIEACSILPRTALTPSTNPDVVRQVLHLTQKRKKRKAEVLALRLLALAQAAAGNLDDAQSSIQQAIQLAKELEDNDLLAAMEFGYAILLWEGSRSSDALNHLHRALHLWEQMEKYPYHALHLLGCIYHSLGQYESMTEVFERILERRELLGEASLNIRDALSHLVEGHAWLGNWEKAYHYFWQMLDNVDSGASDSLFDVEAAIGTLCHGIKDYRRWMWKGIPQTMARAQELIRRLYEHGISPEDKRLERVFHPILAAGYVEYAIKSRNSLPRSHEEGVAMMRLFARQVWILDEHVEFWAYLTGVLNYDRLEAIFEDALAQVDREEPILPNETRDRPEFFHATKPEKLILEWLRACLRERYETDDAGKHLRKLGIIPEPCWLVTGTFEENVPAEVEQEILDVVFNPDNKSRTGSLPVKSGAGSLPVKIEWRAPDDFRDGYIDCRHIFQTMDRFSAYACTAILSPQEQQVRFTVYHDDSIRIWLNGEICFERGDCSYSQFDGTLQQGYNLALIRLTNYEDGWGFILHVTDEDGEVLEELTYTQPHLSSGVALSRQLSPVASSLCGDSNVTDDSDATDNLTQIPMEFSYWAKALSGDWEETAEGIKLYGTAYRGGNRMSSKSFYNFVDSELFIKWMPHGGNGYNYAGFGVGIKIAAPGTGGSTHHAYGKILTRIYDDTWYYTRIKINADKTHTAVMSTGDYDIDGRMVVKSKSVTLSNRPGWGDKLLEYIERTNITVSFDDNYAGTSAYMIVAEVKTDATPVQMTILSSYDFENTVDVPAQFNFTGNWVIDTIGFNSAKSLHSTDSPSSISLEVIDAVAVSFRFKCSGPYSSGFTFYVDGIQHYTGLCREILDQWNELIMPIPGTGTHMLKWSSRDGASLWIDDITIYTLD